MGEKYHGSGVNVAVKCANEPQRVTLVDELTEVFQRLERAEYAVERIFALFQGTTPATNDDKCEKPPEYLNVLVDTLRGRSLTLCEKIDALKERIG